MTRLFLVISAFFLSNVSNAQISDDVFFKGTQDFMIRFTRGDKVDYKRIYESPGLLDSLVTNVAFFSAEGKSDNHLKAYYINAYNLLTIKQVIDNFPIKSPKEVDGFFSKTEFNVGGEKMTLDYFEHELISKKFKDERIHFALACASESCPLMDAYGPNQIDLELSVAKEQFLGMRKHVTVLKDKILISKIFDWYKDEFKRNSFKNTIRHYINSGRDKRLPEGLPIVFRKYDWSLNDIASR